MLQRLQAQGWLRGGGRQRTDATHVFAAARDLNRLEQVAETVRSALEAIASVAASWLVTHVPREWFERYATRVIDYRLPRSDKARVEYLQAVAADGLLLLQTVYDSQFPAWLGEIDAVEALRQTWLQQFYRDGNSVQPRSKDDGRPPAGRLIVSPYDIDARFGSKRGMGWSGYKGHFTETCESTSPRLIVHVATTDAAVADVDTVAARHADLARADLLPDEHLVDAGYVSVDGILVARDEYGIDLIGPLPPDSAVVTLGVVVLGGWR